MNAWLATALGGIVHTREIVEQEGRRMEIFQRYTEFRRMRRRKVESFEHAGYNLRTNEAARILKYMIERIS
jgi:hypothetical protein